MSAELDWKLICKACSHFTFVDEATHKKYEENPSDFKCSVCHREPLTSGKDRNKPRKISAIKVTQCGKCGQTYDEHSRCECPLEDEFDVMKIVYNPKNDWNDSIGKIRKNDIYHQKSVSMFRDKVHEQKLEEAKRPQRIEKLLIENNELLKKVLEKKDAEEK